MPDFVWFFLTVYLMGSYISYTIHSGTLLEDMELSFTTLRNGVGDFSVRAIYIYAMFHTSGQLTNLW